jgi:NAD+ kinase
MSELVCDGALVATSAGSTAYNLSAGGPIIPLGNNLIALTPISPFRPRTWRGALLPSHASIRFEVLDASDRMVSATADFYEVQSVKSVLISEDSKQTAKLLFDPEHNLEERILKEQFSS